MNIIIIIIGTTTAFVITNSFRIFGAKIERLIFKTWLLENNYTKYLDIYSKYEKEEKVK